MKKQTQRFQGRLAGRGPKSAWVFLDIPFNVLEVFGSRARVPVTGTLNGHPFRNSLLPNGDGTHSMPVNKELQAGAKAVAGDAVSVVMSLETAPRTVAIPDDLRASLEARPTAQRAFASLSYSHKKEFVDWIVQAKKPETRARRLGKTIEMLGLGKRLKG
ncbi:MAG: DUF1905 domain-containing protein [Verrucomicrobia bacterium]|nr:DUF1905 domain-containing protein [Verrucomicrobiota bacterium]